MRFLHKCFSIKLLSLLFFVFQGCSLEQFSYKLSNSFDYPEEIELENKVKNKSAQITKNKKLIQKTKEDTLSKSKRNEGNTNLKPVKDKKQNSSATKPSKNIPKDSLKAADFNLRPYRIILKLPRVNPSDPAKTLIKALRKEGIRFEVEKIERYEIKSDNKAFPVNR
tara:strand:+ start:490 stop:990 length:501 start_codon:yes stop_codon:yes gene_type:complete